MEPQTFKSVTCHSSAEEKIALFASLFRGRPDVYPRRFESVATGRSGYQPACANEWVRGVCDKPKVRRALCGQRKDALLRENGDFVLRFLAEDVCGRLSDVLDGILRTLSHRRVKPTL